MEEKKQKKEIPKWKRTLRMIYLRIKRVARLNPDTDVDATIASISKSTEFKGATVWILAFAIIVASVGLNVNSTAVIIGAMLISPLMGPINGVGLAIGISDNALLRKSLNNLGIMVLIGLLASSLYFLLSPLSDAQSELLARTRPTIFDVIIALFGGFAGIVAISRKEQSITIISGVAIATALMPPLCTAGYGLATGQFNYFFGAFYLFFINSFFIALATYIMVRYMQFPQKEYQNIEKKRKEKRYITLFSIIVIVPSIFIAISVIRESSFNNQAIRYINDIQKTSVFDEVQLINSNREYSPKEQTISISLVGKELTHEQIELLQNSLLDYGLKKTKLVVKQTSGTVDVTVQADVLEKLIDKKDIQIAAKDSIIESLEAQIIDAGNNSRIYAHIAQEIGVQYPNVESFSINTMIYFDPKTMKSDTIPTLYVKWHKKPTKEENKRLSDWLKVRLEVDNLKVIE